MTTTRVTPQIICQIIQKCMVLEDDQIWIYNQRRAIPEDKRLYVVVGLAGFKMYGNTNVSNLETGLTDELSQFMQETITIDLFSYTTEALERYPQIMGSLKSSYSQQVQELYALKIADFPLTINDVSGIEGIARLNRISIALSVLRKYSMMISADYYDQLSPGYVQFVNK